MTSPTLELQGAIVARLKGHAPLVALIGQRVYDDVPASATFPYVSLGPTDEIPDLADCIDGAEINVQIDVWSRSVGSPEAQRIAEEVKQALRVDPVLTTNALALFDHRITRRMKDPDGLTTHAVLTFEAFIERPS